jgi:hypothetical protein
MFSPDTRPRTVGSACLPHLVIVALAFLWAIPAISAPKTDIVLFKNGDKLTGEFKSLKRGQLNLNADATGTIGIEWDKVSGIVSNQNIQIETSNGTRYFGVLTYSEEDPGIIVVTDNGPQTLDTARVVSMNPIEDPGIHALDVDLTLGYNFAKAGGNTSANFGVKMDYRSLIRIESLSFDTVITDSDTQDASQRSGLNLQHTRLWKNRWFSNANLSFEQNDELGLDLRTAIGGGGGRYLIQSNSMLWSIEAGLQVSRENLTTEEEDLDSVEALFTLKWDWFLFQDPELDWSTTLQVIPSVTESGRVRGEIDTALKWEIIKDLDWQISVYGSFDNQPQSGSGSTSDYGVNAGLSYEF